MKTINKTQRKVRKIPRKQSSLRNFRLTQKQKRIRFAFVLVMIGILIGTKIPTIKADETHFLDDYEEVLVTINYGDVAWNIQSELTPNQDVRELLYYVELNNDVSVGNLKPGQEIVFYKHK